MYNNFANLVPIYKCVLYKSIPKNIILYNIMYTHFFFTVVAIKNGTLTGIICTVIVNATRIPIRYKGNEKV